MNPAEGGFKGEQKGGRADKQGADQANLGGHQGVYRRQKQQHQRHQERKNILHQKQGGRPFNVVDHPPSLPDNMGQGVEIGIQQHHLGDMLGRLASCGHGHGAVRVLESQYIVDPVSQHGHRMAPGLKALDQGPLLPRGDPAKDGMLFRHPPPVRLAFRQGRQVHPAVRPVHPRPSGHLGRRLGVVAGDDLDGHALLLEVSQSRRSIWPELVGQNRKAQRDQGTGQPVPLQRARALGQQQNPLPSPQGVPQIRFKQGPVFPQQHLRRTQQIIRSIWQAQGAPFALGGKKHLPYRGPGFRLAAKPLLEGGGGGVSPGGRVHIPAQPGGQLFHGAIHRPQFQHLQLSLGQGARLVQAEHIHPRQVFNAGHLMDQSPFPGQLNHTYRQGGAHQ